MSDIKPIHVKYDYIDQFIMAMIIPLHPDDNPIMHHPLLEVIQMFLEDFKPVFNQENKTYRIDGPEMFLEWIMKANKTLFNRDLTYGVEQGIYEYRYDSDKDNFVYFKTQKYVELYGDSNMEPVELRK